MKRIVCIFALLVLLFVGGETVMSASAATVKPSVSQIQLNELRAGGGSPSGGSGSGWGLFSKRARRELDRKLSNGEPLDLFDWMVLLLDYVLPSTLLVGAGTVSFVAVRKRARRKRSAKKVLQKLSNADNAWKYEHICERVSETYYAVQKAWGEGDMTPAKEFMTDELFDQFQQRLDTIRSRNERNILKNIKLDEYYAAAVFDSDDDTLDNAWFFINGSMVDYTYNDELKKITNGNTFETSFAEYWKFVRNRSGEWVLAKVIQENDKGNLPF